MHRGNKAVPVGSRQLHHHNQEADRRIARKNAGYSGTGEIMSPSLLRDQNVAESDIVAAGVWARDVLHLMRPIAR
jgi:hypothetical protein